MNNITKVAAELFVLGGGEETFEIFIFNSYNQASNLVLKLQFWWHIIWPQKIVRKSKLYIPDNSNSNSVSINVLGFITIIINYATAITALLADSYDSDPFSVLPNFSDNISFVRWIDHHCNGSLKARTLVHLSCGILANTFLGINTKWPSTHANFITDAISRIKEESRNSSLLASLDKSILNKTLITLYSNSSFRN